MKKKVMAWHSAEWKDLQKKHTQNAYVYICSTLSTYASTFLVLHSCSTFQFTHYSTLSFGYTTLTMPLHRHLRVNRKNVVISLLSNNALPKTKFCYAQMCFFFSHRERAYVWVSFFKRIIHFVLLCVLTFTEHMNCVLHIECSMPMHLLFNSIFFVVVVIIFWLQAT